MTMTTAASARRTKNRRRLPAAIAAFLGAAALLAARCDAAPPESVGGGVRRASRKRALQSGSSGGGSSSSGSSSGGSSSSSSGSDDSGDAALGLLRQDESHYDPNDGGGASYDSSFPALSDLLSLDGDVIGDVSWMLDFAIVGNAKCGTTFLAHYLNYNSDQTRMPHYEVCKLSHEEPESPGELVELLYDELLQEDEEKLFDAAEKELEEEEEEEERHEEQQEQQSERPAENESEAQQALSANARTEEEEYARRHGRRDQNGPTRHGLKCPKELGTEPSLRNYARYFPETDFLVTVRHPVLWFQSFYNYRFGSGTGEHPRDPNELIGACLDDSPYLCGRRCGKTTYKQNVCTDRAKFHHQLARFGKTPMTDPEELNLLRDNGMAVQPVKGRVFLMELSQVFAGTPSSLTLPGDLSDFLRLERTLPDIKPRKKRTVDPEEEARKTKNNIDICEDKYAPIRSILVETGAEAAAWIKEYFLKSEDVVVSSRDEFERLLGEWSKDPCDDRVEMGRRLEMESQYDY